MPRGNSWTKRTLWAPQPKLLIFRDQVAQLLWSPAGEFDCENVADFRRQNRDITHIRSGRGRYVGHRRGCNPSEEDETRSTQYGRTHGSLCITEPFEADVSQRCSPGIVPAVSHFSAARNTT